MNFYIYILYSLPFNRTYTGQTNSLKNRLHSHNTGKVRSTKAYVPWRLIHSEIFTSRAEAMRREKWFKSKEGRKKISEILDNYIHNNSSN